MAKKLPSTRRGRQRLLKLADMLMADARDKKGIKFDLTTWGSTTTPDAPVSCGTTACAMGLAAISGAFKRQGLTGTIDRGYDRHRILFKWNGRQILGNTAAKRIFEITSREVDYLFIQITDLSDYTGAEGERAVAKRIRRFVAGKSKFNTMTA